jgi:chemotaxis protein MotC
MIARLAAFMIALTQPIVGLAASPELHESVRTLQRLQDAMVTGDADAQKVRVKLLADIAARPAESEKDHRNLRAAIVYLLSGGNAELGSAFLTASDLDAELKPLLEGAIAYAEDNKGKAAELLLPAELDLLPADLAGQIALVRAALRKDGEQDAMRADLRLAAALMPGTLIEESALRRAAALAAEKHDLDGFERAAGRYFRRFANSIYAGQFAEAFAQFVGTLGYEAMPERFAALDGMIGGLSRERAAYVYLEISGHALSRGQRALAAFAAERVGASAAAGSIEAARAALYTGAVLVATDAERFHEGMAMLERVDRSKLIASDVDLLNRARMLATRVEAATASGAPVPTEAREQNGADPIGAIMQKVSLALAEADAALKERQP